MIDEIDQKILDLLQKDARLSNADIGKEVGLNASSVFERVKKLERKGIITGYVATVDAEKIGKPMLAFMRINVDTDTMKNFDTAKIDIEQAVIQDRDILECHHVAGEDCYILKLRANGPKELEQIISRVRSIIHGARSVTSIVLSTYKESSKVEVFVADDEE